MVESTTFSVGRYGNDSALRRIADALLNLCYPERCLVCGSTVSRTRERGVCQGCWDKAIHKKITNACCPSCGLPFVSPEVEPAQLCGECCLSLPPFSGARSFGYYVGELGRLIQELKFHGRRNLAVPLSTLMVQSFFEAWNPEEFDCVVPVPLHPSRKRERGFNQAALLAAGVAELAGVLFVGGILRRHVNTGPQVGLSDARRRSNVQGAFCCKMHPLLPGSRILLVDDVMTTGATAGSASQALLDAGARRVTILTAARAVPGME